MDSGEPCTSSSTTNPQQQIAAGRIKKRRFSSARIQPTRIKKVMQSDEEIGRMVHSVPVAMGSVMEHFAARLLEAAAKCSHQSGGKTLTPNHIRQAVGQNAHFAFLEPLLQQGSATTVAGKMECQESRLGWVEGSTANPNDLNNPIQRRLLLQSQLKVKTEDSRDDLEVPDPGSFVVPEKRKRGRPRKSDKELRFIDEQQLPPPLPPSAANQGRNGADDRVLMPPPKLPSNTSSSGEGEFKVPTTMGIVGLAKKRSSSGGGATKAGPGTMKG